MLKAWVFTIVLLGALTTQAKYDIPDDKDVLLRLGSCQSSPLPPRFQILLWNIKKAENKYNWAQDFQHFATHSDLILVQEGILDDFVPGILLRQKNFCWDFATSFYEKEDAPTGVMSGSVTPPKSLKFLRSPSREPVTNTPKMTLISEYSLANVGKPLLVVNIHGLNFVPDRSNREQIQAVVNYLRPHHGPLIFAGDFNSWNGNRVNQLDKLMTSLGLSKQPIPNDHRKMKLDHIYTRGIELTQITIHNDVKSSDHKPITAEFQIK